MSPAGDSVSSANRVNITPSQDRQNDGGSQVVTTTTVNADVPPGNSPQNLQAQGDYRRFQVEQQFQQTTVAQSNGQTPEAEAALRQVKDLLYSDLINDVEHHELQQIESTLRGLRTPAEVNYVLSNLSPAEMRQWGEDLNDAGLFGHGPFRGFDETEQNNLFTFLAQNATPENLIKMFEGLDLNVDSVSRFMESVSQSAPPAVRDAFLQQAATHPNMERIRNEMLADLAQMGLDIAGIFDPSGVVDGGNALGYLLRGKFGDAILSGLGIVPYLGDLAKAGKLGKFGRLISNVVDMAKFSPEFARAAEAALGKLRDVFKSIPLDSLPAPVREFVENTTRKLDDFFNTRAARSLTDDIASAGYRSSDATRAQFRDMFVNTFGQARYDDYVRAAEQFKAANPQFAHIPTEDLVALRGYTDDVINPATGLRDYQAMNNALRSGDATQLAQFDAYIRCATSALNQLPPSAGTVFRGTNLPANVVNNYTPGQIVTERAFTSTSDDAAQAFPGDTQFVINSTNGRRVDGVSAIPSESEVLFPPGTQFEVLDVRVDPTTGVRTIYMTEVPR